MILVWSKCPLNSLVEAVLVPYAKQLNLCTALYSSWVERFFVQEG